MGGDADHSGELPMRRSWGVVGGREVGVGEEGSLLDFGGWSGVT